MRKNFLVVASYLLTGLQLNPVVAQGLSSYELGQKEAKIRFHKIVSSACEEKAQHWAKFAAFLGGHVARTFQTTLPGSSERESHMREYRKVFQKLADEDYLESKKAKEQFLSSPERKIDQKTQDEHLVETYNLISKSMITILELIILSNPGESEITYRRLLEQECRLVLNKI